MDDPIAPSVAHGPAEAVELVAQALSDGDLEAALAQYEERAVLRPWSAGPADNASAVQVLSELMDLRLPLVVHVRDVVLAEELALVVGERSIKGVAADCEQVAFGGVGATLVRRQPGGGWLIAADAWQLAPPDGGPVS